MEKELVSIITPVYNCEKYIEDTIKSVLNQTYTNWEMILVDDCSTDRSCEIINKYIESEERIKLYRLEENSGAAIARNKAMDMSRGRYIAFLDGDDIWYIDKLEKQVEFMKNNDIAFSFTAYDVIDDEGQDLNKRINVPSQINYKQYLKNTIIQTVTVMIDTYKVRDFKMPPLKRRQDFVTWLRILKKGHLAYGINESLGQYRRANSSLSSNKLKAMKYNWYVYRKVEKLSLVYSIYCFCGYAFQACKKRIYLNYFSNKIRGRS